MSILEVREVKKIYTTRLGGNRVEALKNVSFSVEQGEYVAIMGESGSGKTTLLNILAALDKPTGGSVALGGQELGRIKESAVAAFRRDNLGFVFQDFNLLDTFTLEDNIYLPLVLAGKRYDEMRARLQPIAQELGIVELLKKYPYEVSGGQKQRAAVARALITGPKLVLADEPTGALDSKATDELLRLFGNINRSGQTILMVTHSVKAASHAGRVLFIRDGEVFHQIYRGSSTNEQLYQKISDTLTLLATRSGRAGIHGQTVPPQPGPAGDVSQTTAMPQPGPAGTVSQTVVMPQPGPAGAISQTTAMPRPEQGAVPAQAAQIPAGEEGAR